MNLYAAPRTTFPRNLKLSTSSRIDFAAMSKFPVLQRQKEDGRSIKKASVYSMRYGKASEAAVNTIFDSHRNEISLESLYGVDYSTWKPAETEECLINIWQLSEDATFESLRELYLGDYSITRVHYLISVDSSEICAAAVEKHVLQMEKHKKARKLTYLPVIILLLHEGNVDSEQAKKINAIAERVSATLMVVDTKTDDKVALEHIKTLIVNTLFPKNKETGGNDDDGPLSSLLSRRGPVMTRELWNKNTADSENNALEHSSLVELVDEMMQKPLNLDLEGDEESRGAFGSSTIEEIQQQEHVWLGGLKKFVVEVTRESASAGNSPQKGARPVALAETTGMAAEEDEEEDPGAFFQDLLARK